MNLFGANILIAAQYAAPYEGNFIASLKLLSHKLEEDYQCNIGYVFPKAMATTVWGKAFIEQNRVYLTGESKCLISKREAEDIICDFKPSLIYSHFEGYDKLLYNAAKKFPEVTNMVWHMHDTLSYHLNPIKALYQRFCFFRHYGSPFLRMPLGSKKAKSCPIGREKVGGVVTVSLLAVCKHELNFVRPFRIGIKINETVIPNGININRIEKRNTTNSPGKAYAFLAFGGRNVQKRTDLLMKAAEIISKEIEIRVIIVGGNELTKIANSLFGQIPEWLEIIAPMENINTLFSRADCFVSTSAHETFSYAIAEASIYGLPVIQSDIEGTNWNANNPSTFCFKSEDVEDLKRAMLQVMKEDPDLLRKKCERTRQENINNYSLETWGEKVIDFIKHI